MALDFIFAGKECNLNEILDSREQRVKNFNYVFETYKCSTIVSLCINMPGNVKANLASKTFFQEGCNQINALIPKPLYSKEFNNKTGYEYLLATNDNALDLKRKLVALENSYGYMRMMDIDVIDIKTGPVSRTQLGEKPRTCFVCNCDAKLCASQSLHTEKEIKTAISNYFIELASKNIGCKATESLKAEALCTPKPGLVDTNNNGSHKDMNLDLFIKSANTLQIYFEKMCTLGFNNSSFQELRELGKIAEEAMLQATNNVNTHKGAIFSLGLMAYSYGNCIYNNQEPSAINICNRIKTLVQGIEKEVSAKVLEQRGLGARGQAASGYEIITKYSLPAYYKNKDLSLTLLLILAHNSDSNIVARSNIQTLEWAQKRALDLYNKKASKKEIEELDLEFINKNISPGGSADLLAATYFLAHL